MNVGSRHSPIRRESPPNAIPKNHDRYSPEIITTDLTPKMITTDVTLKIITTDLPLKIITACLPESL